MLDRNTSQRDLIYRNTSQKASVCVPVGLFGHSLPEGSPFDHNYGEDDFYYDEYDIDDTGGWVLHLKVG